MPLEVVDAAIEILAVDGLLVFTVNESLKGVVGGRYDKFLSSLGEDGRAHWNNMKQVDKVVYKHRLNVKGEWIEYTALLYRKVGLENGLENGVN